MPAKGPAIRRPPSRSIATGASLFPPNFDLLTSYSDWRRDWTHIVSGQFSSSPHSSLLFYEQSAGYAEFYDTDGEGGISLLRQHGDWRNSWDLIVPGCFSEPRFLLPNAWQYPNTPFPAKTGFLLYDRQAGFGAIYETDGQGGIIKLAEYSDWRTTWTHIIAGKFTRSPYSGLFFYEQASGYGEMYTTDGAGGITLINSYSWPLFPIRGLSKSFQPRKRTWTHIVPGEFWNDGRVDVVSPFTDLFFYENSSQYGETYASNGQGGLTLVGSQSNLPPATLIIPGSFGGSPFTNLLFYNKAPILSLEAQISPGPTGVQVTAGNASFQQLYYVDSRAVWSVSEEYSDWRDDWDLIVPGNFWMADVDDIDFPDGGFSDLLFYNAAQGLGEFYLHEPPESTPIDPLAGYASAHSVGSGETISFYVASQVGAYRIGIYRCGKEEIPMTDIEATPADPLPITRTAWRDGAGWPSVASQAITEDWPSGLYLARVYVPSTIRPPYGGGFLPREAILPPTVSPLDIPFVVRAANPGQSARILLTIPDTTYEAYNFWGGRSLYGYLHSGNYEFVYPQSAFFVPYGFRVSFQRPYSAVPGQSKKWQGPELQLIQWMERQGIRFDVCCASDLDESNAVDFLQNYKLVLTVGHSEYWSANMKHNLEKFIENGGNAAFLGGNLCYWRVRFEDDPELGRSMICYKQAQFDPISPKTINWNADNFPADPDTKLTGVSGRGWTDYGTPLPQFVVQQPEHWVFANTGLGYNDVFGVYGPYEAQQTIVGSETDVRNPGDARFQLLAGVYVDGTDEQGVPHHLEVASLGIMSPGGTVFTVGTINWALGLSQDCSWNPMDQITRNVLIRLG